MVSLSDQVKKKKAEGASSAEINTFLNQQTAGQPTKPAAGTGQTQVLRPKQGFVSKALDVISAPLSQPKTFFTKGPLAAAEEVRKSREQIKGGDNIEALKVIGTTVASTVVAAGAVLGTAAIASSVSGLTSSGAVATPARVAAEAARIGVNPKFLQSAINKRLVGQAANQLAQIGTKKAFTGVIKTGLTNVFKILTVAGGSGGLVTWLASDNIVGGAAININKIEGRFQDGQITRADALEQTDNMINRMEEARSTINIATIAGGPLLWPFRKVYMSNVNSNLETAQVTRDFIASLPETTGAKFDRLREESDQRQADRDDLQETRDQEFDEKQDIRDLEKDEDFLESVFFFDTKRKRDQGLELTPEELAILIKFGAETEEITSEFDEDKFGRSSLSFGLL